MLCCCVAVMAEVLPLVAYVNTPHSHINFKYVFGSQMSDFGIIFTPGYLTQASYSSGLGTGTTLK